MEINIHQDAIINFNDKAEQILFTFETRTEQKHEVVPNPDIHIGQEIDTKDIIGDVIGHHIDDSGKELDIYFIEKSNFIGLFENNYKYFIRICESIHNRKEIKDLVSYKEIKNIFFDWLIAKFKRKTNKELMSYLIESCQQIIKENTIYIPIHGLILESDFDLGHIRFLKITKEIIDNWEKYLLENANNNDSKNIDKLKTHILKLRTNIQGYAVASFKIVADKSRACEIALEQTDLSLSALRFFSSSNFYPNKNSSCTILGKENIEMIQYLIIDNNNLISEKYETIGNIENNWKIDNKLLSSIKELGLNELHQLLLLNKLNSFQKKLLDSIIIYSKNSLMKNINDKLIYILVSIESLLLKNSSENIIQNIGERIAFLIADNFKDRKLIIDNVRDIYELRSKFIHHGLSIDNIEKIKLFMRLIKFQLKFKIEAPKFEIDKFK